MIHTEALKLALEALEEATNYTGCEAWSPSMTDECLAVAVALKAALEQPEQEPVAMCRTWHKGSDQHAELLDWTDALEALPDGEHHLYTHSPRREWRGLTTAEVDRCWNMTPMDTRNSRHMFAYSIEAALKEKNS